MYHAFLQPLNKSLLYELSQELVNHQYKFHELTSDIIIPEITHKLKEFLDIQQSIVYKRRFSYTSMKDMNKDVLKEVNTFLYYLYKQYKDKYRKKGAYSMTSPIEEVYSRQPQDTQTYKTERQSTLERVMREKQEELKAFTPKPETIDFADKEDTPFSPDEMERMIRERQQEYEQPTTENASEPSLNKIETDTSREGREGREPREEKKRVSFGIAKETPFNKEQPSNTVSRSAPPPSVSNLLSKLKPKPSDREEPIFIPHSSDLLKRVGLYLATTSARHHFARLRGERPVQSEKQRAVLLVNTVTSEMPIDLGEYLQPFEEYLLTHADPLWNWWVFLTELVEQNTPETRRWLRYMDLNTPLDPTYSFLQGWLDQPISIPT